MKNIRRLNGILFDAAGLGVIIIYFGLAALFFAAIVIALIVWAIKLIVKARKKAHMPLAEEETQTKI